MKNANFPLEAVTKKLDDTASHICDFKEFILEIPPSDLPYKIVKQKLLDHIATMQLILQEDFEFLLAIENDSPEKVYKFLLNGL